jgi:hypothetical protein
MTASLDGDLTLWGWASETTVNTAVNAALGIPNTGKVPIESGQEFAEEKKTTGKTVLTTTDVQRTIKKPTWSGATTMFHPQFGEWMSLLTQNVSESGAGPYVQEIEPDQSNAYGVTAITAAAGNRAGTLWQKAGQSSSRDVNATGCIVSKIDVRIPETGLVEVTPTMMALGYGDAVDASSGTYTLPTTTSEKLASDFVFKIGDGTPNALYTREVSLSFEAQVIPRWYGSVFPYMYHIAGWTVSGSFTKPIVAATDTLSKSHFVGSSLDQLLYIYSATMTDYDEAAASLADGEMRFTLNIKLDKALPDFGDDSVESIDFKGIDDGTNAIWKAEQCTTASQTWAS